MIAMMRRKFTIERVCVGDSVARADTLKRGHLNQDFLSLVAQLPKIGVNGKNGEIEFSVYAILHMPFRPS